MWRLPDNASTLSGHPNARFTPKPGEPGAGGNPKTAQRIANTIDAMKAGAVKGLTFPEAGGPSTNLLFEMNVAIADKVGKEAQTVSPEAAWKAVFAKLGLPWEGEVHTAISDGKYTLTDWYQAGKKPPQAPASTTSGTPGVSKGSVAKAKGALKNSPSPGAKHGGKSPATSTTAPRDPALNPRGGPALPSRPGDNSFAGPVPAGWTIYTGDVPPVSPKVSAALALADKLISNEFFAAGAQLRKHVNSYVLETYQKTAGLTDDNGNLHHAYKDSGVDVNEAEILKIAFKALGFNLPVATAAQQAAYVDVLAKKYTFDAWFMAGKKPPSESTLGPAIALAEKVLETPRFVAGPALKKATIDAITALYGFGGLISSTDAQGMGQWIVKSVAKINVKDPDQAKFYNAMFVENLYTVNDWFMAGNKPPKPAAPKPADPPKTETPPKPAAPKPADPPKTETPPVKPADPPPQNNYTGSYGGGGSSGGGSSGGGTSNGDGEEKPPTEAPPADTPKIGPKVEPSATDLTLPPLPPPSSKKWWLIGAGVLVAAAVVATLILPSSRN